MAIDMASVYAARYRKQPDMLRAAVMGQSPDPKLDSYTALNALRLVKEADMMDMAGKAQQPTSAPSLVAQNMAPPPMMQGLGAMVPGAMGQAPQGMPPQQRAPMPQPTMQAASGGLAGMYTPEEDFAEGGIVAFQSGGPAYTANSAGAVAYPSSSGDAVTDNPLDRLLAETENGTPNTTAIGRAQEALEKYMAFEPTEMSAKEQEAFLDRYMARVEKAGGPNIYAPARADTEARRAALAGDRRTGEGMALLTAAGKILKGRSLAEGASEALPAYAQQMGEVKRAEQQEKRAIEQMNFALNDAERKERMGNQRGAQAALEAARKFQQDANRAHGDKLRFAADIAARTVGYSKVNKAAGSGADKEQPLDRVTAAMNDKLIEMRAKDPNDPQIAILEAKIKGRKEIIGMGKEGPTAAPRAAAALTAKQNAIVVTKLAAWDESSEAYKARKDGTYADKKASKEADLRRQAMEGVFGTGDENDETPSAAPAAAPTAKPKTVLKFDQSGKQIK
jgi:hypothetical protein